MGDAQEMFGRAYLRHEAFVHNGHRRVVRLGIETGAFAQPPFSLWSPDVPGCGVCGYPTVAAALEAMREALAMHWGGEVVAKGYCAPPTNASRLDAIEERLEAIERLLSEGD